MYCHGLINAQLGELKGTALTNVSLNDKASALAIPIKEPDQNLAIRRACNLMVLWLPCIGDDKGWVARAGALACSNFSKAQYDGIFE